MEDIKRRKAIKYLSLIGAGTTLGFPGVWHPSARAASSGWKKTFSAISSLSSSAARGLGTMADVLTVINTVKTQMAEEDLPGEAFEGVNPINMQKVPSQTKDVFSGGQQWLPQLKKIAGEFGNPLVPKENQPLFGVNLNGTWSPPLDLNDQTYIRQYGPYINLIGGVQGTPLLFGEGVFDINSGNFYILGLNISGFPFQMRLILESNWLLYGSMAGQGLWGQPVNALIGIQKVS